MPDPEFEWDEEKATANFRKHGIAFEGARGVFDDPQAIHELDLTMDYGEDRMIVVGLAAGRLLTVVYTERGESIRLISARKATRHEEECYHRSKKAR